METKMAKSKKQPKTNKKSVERNVLLYAVLVVVFLALASIIGGLFMSRPGQVAIYCLPRERE
jgi:hypothetical protein